MFDKVIYLCAMICYWMFFTAMSMPVFLAGIFAENILLGILIVVPIVSTYVLVVAQIIHDCKKVLCAKD